MRFDNKPFYMRYSQYDGTSRLVQEKVYIMFNTSDYTVITNDKIKEFNLLCSVQMSDLLDFDATFEKEFLEDLENA